MMQSAVRRIRSQIKMLWVKMALIVLQHYVHHLTFKQFVNTQEKIPLKFKENLNAAHISCG